MAKALNRKQTRLTAHHYIPDIDSYLVLGRLARAKTDRAHFTGWISRHQPDRIHAAKHFADAAGAAKSFDATFRDQKLSGHRSLTRDWQQNRVYDWEGENVYPHKKPLTREAAQKLLNRVSRDYDIEAPRLVWRKQTDSSGFLPDENEIHFGHRDTVGMLHELAHAIHEDRRDPDQPIVVHGPQFVATAIELYSRYIGLSHRSLTRSAHESGLLGESGKRKLGVNPAIKGPR